MNIKFLDQEHLNPPSPRRLQRLHLFSQNAEDTKITLYHFISTLLIFIILSYHIPKILNPKTKTFKSPYPKILKHLRVSSQKAKNM